MFKLIKIEEMINRFKLRPVIKYLCHMIIFDHKLLYSQKSSALASSIVYISTKILQILNPFLDLRYLKRVLNINMDFKS